MPGQYVDAESGLFYNWNRYYNPAIGRYISNDPIGIDGGLNTFLYADANPVMYADPTGEEPLTLTLTGTAVLPTLGQLCLANPATCLIGGSAAGLLAGYHGLGAIPGIQEACDAWVKNDGFTGILEMAKGGKKNIQNEYTRLMQNIKNPDPCKELQKMYNQEKDSAERLKIKTAMKYFNCDNRGRFQ